jgi:hypothetical protein
MPIIRNSSSEHTGKKNVRQIYSGYRINVQANQLGIPAIPRTIKGPSGDITQSLAEGPVNFTPAELTAILTNNSGSAAASGPPPPTPLTFTSGSPPSFPYTIPASYTLLTFTLIGGGGSGGGNYDFPEGGGGAGGAYIRARFSVNGGGTLTLTKGIGGAGAIVDSDHTSVNGSPGTSTGIVYNTSVINISAPGGGGGYPGGGCGYCEPVTSVNSSVTVINSAPGNPGDVASGDYSTGYSPGAGGLAGNNIAGAGQGSGGGNSSGNGTDGYWEFTIT